MMHDYGDALIESLPRGGVKSIYDADSAAVLAPYKDAMLKSLHAAAESEGPKPEQSSYLLRDGTILNYGCENHTAGQIAAVNSLPADLQNLFFDGMTDDDASADNLANIVPFVSAGAVRLNSARDNCYMYGDAQLTPKQEESLLSWLDMLALGGYKGVELSSDAAKFRERADLTRNSADDVLMAFSLWLRLGRKRNGMLESLPGGAAADFTEALISEYIGWNDHWHSYDSEHGYRGVDCKNLPQSEIDRITGIDHGDMIVRGNSLKNEFPDGRYAKITVDGNELWDYLYYRGGTKERPTEWPMRTILDVSMLRSQNIERARKFFTDAVKVEDTVLVTTEPYRYNIYECIIAWYNAKGVRRKSIVWLPTKFLKQSKANNIPYNI